MACHEKKLPRTKLALNTQTLRVLDSTALAQVGGGASNNTTCASCTIPKLGVVGGVIPVY